MNGTGFVDAATGAELDEAALSAAFDEWLDCAYPVLQVAGVELPPSRALAATDPIAYRCALLDWADSQVRCGDWAEL